MLSHEVALCTSICTARVLKGRCQLQLHHTEVKHLDSGYEPSTKRSDCWLKLKKAARRKGSRHLVSATARQLEQSCGILALLRTTLRAWVTHWICCSNFESWWCSLRVKSWSWNCLLAGEGASGSLKAAASRGSP